MAIFAVKWSKTPQFRLGGSRENLKVHEAVYIPGDPAIMCPSLFKGSRSLLVLT